MERAGPDRIMKGEIAVKRCVVTGAAGFIGSNLVRRLIAEGVKVTAIDDLSTGHVENLDGLLGRIHFVKGDIRDLALLREAFAGADVVFHEAALASVPRSVEDPITTNQVNIDGTLSVLMAAKEAGVRRVVYAASSSAYGDTETLPKTEDMPSSPLSPYAVQKYCGELYANVFTRVYGLETVSLRYFNIFGPYQDPKSQYAAVVPQFIVSLMAGRQPVIYGDGEQSRDFTYVANACEANILAASAPGASGRVFNIGCGEQFTINHLLEKLNELIGTDTRAAYAAPRPGDVRESLASIARAEEYLGYRPVVRFDEGLAHTVRWFLDHGAHLGGPSR